MLKRFYAAFAALFVLTASAMGAGTVPGFSLTPQFDTTGAVAKGCKLYVIQAGTTATPQNSYQDSALTLAQPNPLTCDATGRLPQFFLADGQIKLRLTTSTGGPIFTGDNLLVIGPSSGGGGGGGSVDPTTVAATGDLKASYGTSVLSGWVRANGRTIGSSTSGATERANADCNALFVYLWGADSSLAVSGGRGASAAADWSANKTIALPDWRGRTIAGLDDMGNSAAGVLTNAANGFGNLGGNPTQLGNGGGLENSVLIGANLPPYTPSGTVSTSIISNGLPVQVTGGPNVGVGGTFTGGALVAISASSSFTGTAQGGSSTRFVSLSPTRLATIYMKL